MSWLWGALEPDGRIGCRCCATRNGIAGEPGRESSIVVLLGFPAVGSRELLPSGAGDQAARVTSRRASPCLAAWCRCAWGWCSKRPRRRTMEMAALRGRRGFEAVCRCASGTGPRRRRSRCQYRSNTPQKCRLKIPQFGLPPPPPRGRWRQPCDRCSMAPGPRLGNIGMVVLREIVMIHDLRRQGLSISAIARRTGLGCLFHAKLPPVSP